MGGHHHTVSHSVQTECPHFHAKYQAYLQRCNRQGLGDTSHHMSIEGYASQAIQSWWRNNRVVVRKRARHTGDRTIGPKPMGVKVTSKRRKGKRIQDVQEAVLIIQRSWRRRNVSLCAVLVRPPESYSHCNHSLQQPKTILNLSNVGTSLLFHIIIRAQLHAYS
jgi:hypothetical protein